MAPAVVSVIPFGYEVGVDRRLPGEGVGADDRGMTGTGRVARKFVRMGGVGAGLGTPVPASAPEAAVPVAEVAAPAPAPPARTPASSTLRTLTPGLLAATAGTAVAFTVTTLLPAVSALTAAVVLGIAVGGFLPERTRAGVQWVSRKTLRLGVVLLGLQLGLGEVFGLGAGMVAAVVVTVGVSFAGTLLLGRLLGVPRGLTLMVATGFSICGASAIAAMDSVTDTDKEEVATAVTLVTLYGSAAIAFVPFLGHALGMSDAHLGAWAGLSVHEVAQVVAAASPAGPAAVALAVVVKLTRVVLLAPMVAGVSVTRRGEHRDGRLALVPLFVVGFLLMVAVRSTGFVPQPALDSAKAVTTLLFAAALFALGSGVRAGALLRTGRRGLVLGALSTVLVAGVGYGALAVVGV